MSIIILERFDHDYFAMVICPAIVCHYLIEYDPKDIIVSEKNSNSPDRNGYILCGACGGTIWVNDPWNSHNWYYPDNKVNLPTKSRKSHSTKPPFRVAVDAMIAFSDKIPNNPASLFEDEGVHLL